MNMLAISAHMHCIEVARLRGDLRTVHGYQYPVPLGEFERWEEQQKELFKKQAKRLGAKFLWRSIFRKRAA